MLVIGIIRAPHGLTGTFKVQSTSGEVEHFFDLTEVVVRRNKTETLFKVEEVKGFKNNLIMKLCGINSLEEAKAFSGAEILVPREKACFLNENEFYVNDLEGCSLIYAENKDELTAMTDSTKRNVGTITGVVEGGAGDLLEVDVSESVEPFEKRSVLIPFRKEFIGDIDLKNKEVYLMHLWILEK
ncbi:MAG: 16S rRNA processing protein RimM [Treponema sp. CETP13]|nr:MAG: 16S rRNA processing protein RimM [Treponema sp. CETP13]